MYPVDRPLRFVLRGKIPALKNNRVISQNENGRFTLPPNQAVLKAIGRIKSAVMRQLPPATVYPLIPLPLEVWFLLRLGVLYSSPLPKEDVDNSSTTVQEAMQGVIYEDDRQVGGFIPYRKRFTSEVSLHSVLYVWTVEPGHSFGSGIERFLGFPEEPDYNDDRPFTTPTTSVIDIF